MKEKKETKIKLNTAITTTTTKKFQRRCRKIKNRIKTHSRTTKTKKYRKKETTTVTECFTFEKF